ncbi:Eco29kI family restriction endonuclease [Actinomadura terrae]|uniref:Eco29kI family restriction endonuclease n=1 Tax=Actinomadura terrae TaxID=604353 RepID=UPI0023430BCA|nr:Eco29kI family restriction endonuclease [Actinomadura terrae]
MPSRISRNSTPARPKEIGDRFDPLSLDQLSRNLREALDDQPRIPLKSLPSFPGAGLYALYYTGSLPLYERLKDGDVPVYVGKAEAGNSSYGDPPDEAKPALYDRIVGKHRVSLEEASAEDCGGNLNLTDFDVRILPLDDVWIVLGERALLRAYSPVLWNTLIPGFGANPSGTARTNARSIWDTIHPGRPRAANRTCNRRFTRAEMEDRIRDGIAISLLPEEDPQREARVRAVRWRRANMIWSPAKKGASDQRLRVYRVDAFIAENAALGVDIGPNDWVDARGDTASAQPDPEEATEGNVLDAEHGEVAEDEAG